MGGLFSCLTPDIMPSLHTLELGCGAIRPDCVQRLRAALRQDALLQLQVDNGRCPVLLISDMLDPALRLVTGCR
jgi:hypothetical protein